MKTGNTSDTESSKPFSVLELLVVVSIIALLIGILIPAPGRNVRGPGITETLLTGWFQFPVRVLSSATVNWHSVMVAGFSFVALVLAAHLLFAWIFASRNAMAGESDFHPPRWRLRSTFLAALLVVLVFACTLNAIATIHQTAWIFSGRERMTVPTFYDEQSTLDEQAELMQLRLPISAPFYGEKLRREEAFLGWGSKVWPVLEHTQILLFKPENESDGLIGLILIPRNEPELLDEGFRVVTDEQIETYHASELRETLATRAIYDAKLLEAPSSNESEAKESGTGPLGTDPN